MKKIFIVMCTFLLIVFSIIVFVAAQDEILSNPIEQSPSLDTASDPEIIPESQPEQQTAEESGGQPQQELQQLIEQQPTEELEQLELADTETMPNADDNINNELEFNVDAGITPDNPIYFIKDTYQRVAVGNNPERALDYREQKIAEAKVMVEEGKPEEAKQVLDRALQYGDIVEREVSPGIKDKVTESSKRVEGAINNMKENTEGMQWKDVNEGFDNNIEQGKKVETAAELSAKISELCETLAKLDPLQYADSCKPRDNSPKWMKEQDKQLTTEQEQQAQVFFNQLSACFENPKQCDCKGIGVQKFEDFCVEQSALAVKCEDGDKTACKSMNNGAPEDLLPDYLIPVMRKVEDKYSTSQFNNFAPDECVKANAKTSDECNKIMFQSRAPQECLDAGLTGKSREDETKCRNIMFQENIPQECIDKGLNTDDVDGARKCAKVMFQSRAPKACLDAGLTGEGREDENKCRGLMQQDQGENPGLGGNMPVSQFNRDCNAIQDINEKMKCYEEFYNNAQVQIKDDFRQREMIDQNTGEKITPEEETQRKICRDKGMGTILEHDNGRRLVICVDKNQPNAQGMQQCQSQDQVEKLKQDCSSRGQNAQVEIRGGCPWIICMGQGQNLMNQQPGQQPGQFVAGDKSGIKCPDNICDDYEKMNPYACPEDCGGTRQPGSYPQQQPGNFQPPQNFQQPIGNFQQPDQQVCSGQAPSCAPNGAPFCQNGNWVCPSTQLEPQPMQPQQPSQELQQPIEQQPLLQPSQELQQPIEQQPVESSEQPIEQQPAEEPQPEPAVTETSASSEGESAPVTGAAITGRVITSVYGDETTRDGDAFLDYWFRR